MGDNDIYFDPNYGKLYEKAENGKAVVFELNTNNGKIINQFIKREIPIQINGNKYFDIVTPYGYGGPLIIETTNKKQLLKEYEEQFEKYCKENKIVAEFVRFHPIIKNYIDFKEIYNPTFNRYTLATNIKDYDDPVKEEFAKHCKKTIKQILKHGVSFKMIENPAKEDIDTFMNIYYQNMERKEAEDYYFFDDTYFDLMTKNFNKELLIAESVYQNKIIAAGLYFKKNKLIHAHLSGTNTTYLYLSPAYILKYGTVIWAKEHGYNFIHYGGGVSTSENDSLYQFKSKFAKNTKFEFWIGKKIWNTKIYKQICKEAKTPTNSDFFPAYREQKI